MQTKINATMIAGIAFMPRRIPRPLAARHPSSDRNEPPTPPQKPHVALRAVILHRSIQPPRRLQQCAFAWRLEDYVHVHPRCTLVVLWPAALHHRQGTERGLACGVQQYAKLIRRHGYSCHEGAVRTVLIPTARKGAGQAV